MAKIVLIYGSGYGQTRKISERIAGLARAKGHEVLLLDGKHLPRGFSLAGADAAIIGASVHLQKHQKYITRFAAAHRAELERIPSAFFSVCISIVFPGGRTEARGYVENFERRTGWHPSLVAIFAGEIAYTRYGWIMRRAWRLMVGRAGGPTDTSRDHEFTDWTAVERFTGEFLATLPAPERGAGPRVSGETPAPAP